MKGLLERLKKKWGPLPVWAWAAASGAVGFLYLRRKGAPATADTTAQPDFGSSIGGASDVGDLPGGTAGGASGDTTAGPVDATPGGLEFGDRNIASSVGDFVDQLLAQEQARVDEARAGADTSSSSTDPTTGDGDSGRQPAPTPKPTGKKPPARKRTKGKKQARPSPPKPKQSTRRNRAGKGAPKHGGGSAGARARTPAHRAAPKPARPRPPAPAPRHRSPRPAAPKRPPLRRAGGRPR